MNECEFRVDRLRAGCSVRGSFNPARLEVAFRLPIVRDAPDKDYLRRWARELEVADKLERLSSGESKPKNT